MFKDFNLSTETQKTLEALGFTQPTEIQRKAIPQILAQPKIDVHGQAQTGTGKTLAFGIPLVQRIDASVRAPQGLVVAPTRELALQIYDSLNPFAKAHGIQIAAIYGGVSMDEQIRTLKKGAQLIIGTPGRLNDHVRRKTLNLSAIKTLVLDEADIMLDMGFKEEVDEILQVVPQNREIWLFSATVKTGISTLMAQHMSNPLSIRVSKSDVGTNNTKQYFCAIPGKSRLNALCRFIECSEEFYAFIFCQTKILTSEVADQLVQRGYAVAALHGDMSQAARNAVIKKFKNKEITIVVATDVAARGIDIANLTHVVNYSLPEDHESYVHRVGRTGRAGRDGVAITFINRSEVRLLSLLQRKFNVTIKPLDIPSRQDIIKIRLEKAASYVANLATKQINDQQLATSLKTMIAQFSGHDLEMTVMQLLHDKFLGNLDGEETYASSAQVAQSGTSNGMQELALAVGSDDDLDKQDILAYLTQTGVVSEDQISKIRVIKRRTFIEVPEDIAAQLMDVLRNSSLAGRKTRIQLVNEQEEDNRRPQFRHNKRRSFEGGNSRFRRR